MASVLDPFLKRALSLAILHRLGNLDVCIERFIIWVKGSEIRAAPSLKKVPGSLSIPGTY